MPQDGKSLWERLKENYKAGQDVGLLPKSEPKPEPKRESPQAKPQPKPQPQKKVARKR